MLRLMNSSVGDKVLSMGLTTPERFEVVGLSHNGPRRELCSDRGKEVDGRRSIRVAGERVQALPQEPEQASLVDGCPMGYCRGRNFRGKKGNFSFEEPGCGVWGAPI